MAVFEFTEEDVSASTVVTPDPGTYSAEVESVKWMGNGSLMLKYKSAETGDRLCNDFLNFSEKAKYISAKKLKQLGLEKDDEGKYALSDEGQELVGKRVTLNLIVDDNPKYLTPDFSSDNHGYKMSDDSKTPEDIPF
jgi:hypothetical protein